MIFINDIPSLRNPEHDKHNLDHRIEKFELINGTAFQSYGHVASGDTFAITCVFSVPNLERLIALWEAEEPVTYTDSAGVVWQNRLLVLRSIEPYKKYESGYKIVTLEIWSYSNFIKQRGIQNG